MTALVRVPAQGLCGIGADVFGRVVRRDVVLLAWMTAVPVAGVVPGDRQARLDELQAGVSVAVVDVTQQPVVAVAVVATRGSGQLHVLAEDHGGQEVRGTVEATLSTFGGVNPDQADAFLDAALGEHVDRVTVDDVRNGPQVSSGRQVIGLLGFVRLLCRVLVSRVFGVRLRFRLGLELVELVVDTRLAVWFIDGIRHDAIIRVIGFACDGRECDEDGEDDEQDPPPAFPPRLLLDWHRRSRCAREAAARRWW